VRGRIGEGLSPGPLPGRGFRQLFSQTFLSLLNVPSWNERFPLESEAPNERTLSGKACALLGVQVFPFSLTLVMPLGHCLPGLLAYTAAPLFFERSGPSRFRSPGPPFFPLAFFSFSFIVLVPP